MYLKLFPFSRTLSRVTILDFTTFLAETQEMLFYDLRLNRPLPPFLMAFIVASTPITA